MECRNPGLWRSILSCSTVLFCLAYLCGCFPVRLDPGPNYGYVQVYDNGSWQQACIMFYSIPVDKICNQLGFNTTRNEVMRQAGTLYGFFWNGEIYCSSTDADLSQCSFMFYYTRTICYDYQIPRIACLSDDETQVDIENHNITVADGLSFNTRCNVYTPHTNLSYQWSHNWKNIFHSGTSFSATGNRTVAGNWTCSVSSEGVTIGSDSTVLNVLYPPERLQSKVIYARIGDAVSLSDTDVSFPSPETFTWRRFNTNSSLVTSATPPVLSNIQQKDAGEYVVLIQQPAFYLTSFSSSYRGNYSFGVQLVKIRIPYPPTIQCEKTVRVRNGQSRSVRCLVDSYPKHHVLTWTLATATGTRTQSSHQDIFNIDNASARDEGTYTCTATNNLTYPDGQVETGTGSCVINVKVMSPSGGAATAAADRETTSSAVWGGLALVAIMVIGLLVAVILLTIRQPSKKDDQNGDKPVEMTTVSRTSGAVISNPMYENT
ncbi:opioid-binding protein/cell adhesion molecule-like [Haliotis rubra]|uniref:opioid-binding protein/cell adhesion molecule-like n=1 Tax=Haliotis rubra TaxID=36100 RepID=UPI001EE5DA18|nr:opioid-binding protein/cell adhesion molecule-like [Haliotis rubra]XP_046543358.1 opioid-binding protein/cell adhesion molecule-like [Haliotis rubra]